MNVLDRLLQAIVADPLAEGPWLVLADWLDEYDDPLRAELLRLHRQLLASCCEPEEHPERLGQQARLVRLLADGVRPCVPQRRIVLAGGVEMTFSFIPPGSFLMGSPPDEEGRSGQGDDRQRVSLTRGFWMGTVPVTVAQWEAVTGSGPCDEGEGRLPKAIRWDDAAAFCGRLGEGFRLPTEAEWEYACRAGTTTAYHSGDGPDAIRRAGWCDHHGNYRGYRRRPYLGRAKGIKAVGQLLPNAWGLYDTHGNVWEWCRDWYGQRRDTGERVDPTGPGSGTRRVLRGGCW